MKKNCFNNIIGGYLRKVAIIHRKEKEKII